VARAGENQTQPKGDPPALPGTSKDRGLILPDDMHEKIQPLYNPCKHEVEKRGRCKRENEDKFNKQLWAIQGTFGQAFMRIAKRLKIDWIKDGSPHSYGSYRYRELVEADDSVTGQTAKSTPGLRLMPVWTNDH
jgi:hypothetical protein